jgi:MFS family permease
LTNAMPPHPANRRFLYYGWWVVGAGGLAMAFITGPYFFGSGMWVTAIERDFGWSKVVLAGAFSVSRVEGSILGPLAGYLTDRFSPARMMLVGFIIMGIGFLLMTMVTNPVTFYIAFFVVASGAGIGGMIPAMVAVNNWFHKNRSLAMALVIAGSSLGGLLIPLLALGITNHGWRMTSFGVGVVIILAGFPLSRILDRLPSKGETSSDSVPSGPVPQESVANLGTSLEPEFTARQALRTRAFWLLSFAQVSGNMGGVAIVVHGVLHLTDVGLSLQLAAVVVASYTAITFASNVVGGLLGDRVNKIYAMSAFMVLQSIGILLFAYISSPSLAFIFAVVFGIGLGGRSPLLHSLRAEYFGRKSFGTILGFSSTLLNVGMMAAPPLVGILADVQGTYQNAFLILAVIALSGAVAALAVRRPSPPGQPFPQR